MPHARAYVGIGTNLGDRGQNISRALGLMKEAAIHIIRVARTIETEPWGVTDQPMFLNTVAEVETGLEPLELFRALKNIEARMGRDMSGAVRWGPRVIDLDVLLYGESAELVLETPELTIPHPHMHEREFVLAPLAELAPGVAHPVMGNTMAELLGALRG